MRERPHDAAQEERQTELPGLQRSQVVDDVLNEGESDPDQGAVDDAIEQAVHFGTSEDHDRDEKQAFRRLLDEGRSYRGIDELVSARQPEEELRTDKTQCDGRNSTPTQRCESIPSRLRLVAIKPE